jgi:hypothetical protein
MKTVAELEQAVAEKNSEFLSTSSKYQSKYYRIFSELQDLVKQLKAAKQREQLSDLLNEDIAA